jgi:hypothetical protein
MTLVSKRPPMLASACPSNGDTTLSQIARSIVGADLLPTPFVGHVAGVSPVAAQLPQTVQSPERIRVQGSGGSYATKPESIQLQTQMQIDEFRGVPPRGRPV